jgi:hypothetical protein
VTSSITRAAPEYNYGDANGNGDYAALALLGLGAIFGVVEATRMDYNEPIKFVLGALCICSPAWSHLSANGEHLPQ